MKTPDFISTAPPPLKSMQYDTLLSEGVAACQQLGGEIWTDYNEHDPGRTILEQLCYAITDIGSRVNYPVADILAGAPGEIDQEGQATFFTGDEILSCDPLTAKDYRKLLYDRVTGLKNVWLQPVTGHPLGIAGLYQVLIETYSDENDGNVLQQVQDVLHAHRNLAEDIESVAFVGHFDVMVEATLDVRGDASPTAVLAEVLSQIQNAFTPFPVVATIDQRMQENIPPDQIFVGPRLSLGVIDDEQLGEPKTSISVQDVRRIIFQVDGVKAIKHLTLKVAERDGAENTASERRFKALEADGDGIGIPDGQVPRVWPLITQPQEVYTIKIEQDGKPYPIDANRVKWRLEQLAAELKSREVNAEWQMENLAYRKLPQGTYRNIQRYHSIQHQFPYTYGIGKYGVPRQRWLQKQSLQGDVAGADRSGGDTAAHAQRAAQARQLKAYLLFFEQLLANYSSQLAHAPRLFSLDPDFRHSYFPQPLVDKREPAAAPPNLSELLNGPTPEAVAPHDMRYVAHISDGGAQPGILLRSREAESPAALAALEKEILHFGGDEQKYRRQTLPSGEFRLLLLNGQTQSIAFGVERFAARHDAWQEVRRLAGLVRSLAASASLRARQITRISRGVLGFQLIDDHGKILLRADQLSAAGRVQRIEQMVERGGRVASYRIEGLGSGQFRAVLIDRDGQTLALGEQRFATAVQARQAILALADWILRRCQDAAGQARYIRRVPHAAAPAGPDVLTFYSRSLLQMMRKFDPYLERRHRFLDHLLSRFNERFEDETLSHVDPRPYGEKDDFFQELIGWKSAFLKNYLKLSGQRGRGGNYFAAAGGGASDQSGLAHRLHRLLGIALPAAAAGDGAQRATGGPGKFQFAGIGRADREQIKHAFPDLEHAFVFSSDRPDIMQSLLKFGTQYANYEVVHTHDAYQVVFHWPDDTEGREVVYRAAGMDAAKAAIDEMIRYLRGYALDSQNIYAGEELYVVEHVLLRPRSRAVLAEEPAAPGTATEIKADVNIEIATGAGIAHLHFEIHGSDARRLARILTLGREAANYRLEVDLSGSHKLALHDKEGQLIAKGKRTYRTASEAMEGLRSLLEDFDVTPAAQEDSAFAGNFYSLRASVFLPDWPIRFQSSEFKDLVARMVGENCPAHVAARCFWLSARQMAEFKKRHGAWMRYKSDPDCEAAGLDRLAAALKSFIEELQTMSLESR